MLNMKRYTKPVIFIDPELAEGVYAESGAARQIMQKTTPAASVTIAKVDTAAVPIAFTVSTSGATGIVTLGISFNDTIADLSISGGTVSCDYAEGSVVLSYDSSNTYFIVSVTPQNVDAAAFTFTGYQIR